MPINTLQNQNIWLTGASSGIGKDLLELLLEQKCNVIASSRNTSNLSYLMQKYPKQLTLMPVDVSDPAAIKTCIAQLATQITHLDKVILNAGICEYFDAPGFDGECIRKNFSVNFFGMVTCIEEAWNLLMAAKSPHLIGVSSAVAYLPLPRAEGYGASKAAILYMLRAMQVQRAGKMDISIICPGFVATPLTAKNTFQMPLLWSSEKAAKYILNGIIKRKKTINFPLLLILAFKLINMLPDNIRVSLLARITSKS